MKKTEEKGVKASKLSEAMERMNKQYGVGSILSLDDKTEGNYDLISSGSLAFDYKTLGVGGFVKGKLYELMGWEGTGKTTICGEVVANCQKNGGKAAYIDGEHAIDRNYFQALGVDTTAMLVAQPSCGEEGFNIAMELINTGEIDLIIIDSDSSLIPKKVLDGEVGDSAIGRKALLNSNAYPKLKSALSQYNVCVIVISQYREKIGVMFGNPTTTQGGHALKFYSDCRIEVSKSLTKDGDVVVSNKTKVKAIKNKMSPPFRISEFEIVYGKGIDKFAEIIELAVEFEIIKKAGSWFSYGDTKLGQGVGSVVEILANNKDLFEEIKDKVIKEITNECTSKN
jgi:recombination protein RecA